MKIFIEKQRFNQWWLILLEISILLVISYKLIKELIQIKSGENTETLTSLLLSLTIVLIVFIFIFSIKLTTRIDEIGVSYQLFPIHLKMRTIKWQELSDCYVRKYNPLLEYGGWGIRGFNKKFGKGMAFNTRGDMGIQLIFKDGGKLLIGTQLPDKVKETLLNYKQKM